jgi:hypothetical protein
MKFAHFIPEGKCTINYRALQDGVLLEIQKKGKQAVLEDGEWNIEKFFERNLLQYQKK